MTRDDFLANLWRWSAGFPERFPELVRRFPELGELRKTEWSPEFERMMRNRLLVGAFRYGRLRELGKPKYNRLEAIVARVRRYMATGDVDLLADIANLALLEYEEGKHPDRHLGGEEHAETVRKAR